VKNQQREHITHREDLAGEHPFGDKGQLLLLVTFFVIWICDSFIFKYTTFLQESVPFKLNIILGLLVILTAFFFVRHAMRNFDDNDKKPKVFDKGAFSVVRHPIYFSANLLYIGFTFLTMSIASAMFWLVILFFYIFIANHEEKLLLNKFGEDYIDYKKSVPMLFPKRLRKK